ncbi:hypothetical protein [Pontiella agarivorans]|uniref:DNA ligase (NAD(+)) n=1 Tax=Pontiella agarivorans TaxID=3038953 RepID=A0ABU5MSY8_9BACT|nr:hypothetical protein [Pontiella agarivorans]MDZ8117321.1 hypothetical protein [Pontiella agarivorans]
MAPLLQSLKKMICLGLLLIIPPSVEAVPEEIRVQAGHLKAILAQADEAYYNRDESIMGDEAYDVLRGRYEQLVADFPELADTPGVGATGEQSKIRHRKPVLSLKKAYSDDQVARFIKAAGTEALFCIEPKIDGMSLVLHYQNGILVRALTRGDGEKGSDVTRAVMAAGCVPTGLKGTVSDLSLRGELFFTHAAFEKLNSRRVKEGQAALKSARNSASGTMRLSDYAEIARRGLSFSIFEWIASDELTPATHQEALELLWELGFSTVESTTVSADRVFEEITTLNGRRSILPYETDGIVIRINNRARFQEMGETARYPRGALARKYKSKPMITQLLRVEWSQGETGKWTPVAHFEPIEMEGATIRSATLHNEDYLHALDVRIGDWIQVIRAGGTVPEIIGICTDRRTGKETPVPAKPTVKKSGRIE